MKTLQFRSIIILFLSFLFVNLFVSCGGGEKPEPLEIKDGDKVIAKFEKPFIFDKGTGNLTNPEDFNDLAKLKGYLAKNEKKIVLSGLYNEKDGNNSVGKARAEAVKNLLNKFNIDNSFIQTASKSSTNYIIIKDLAYNPLEYRFLENVSEETKLARKFENGKAFHYNYAVMQSRCSMNSSLRSHLDDLKKYLKLNPNAKIVIDGHCDITGTERLNKWLSHARSRKMKQLLIKNGFDRKKIKTYAYGYSKPIGNNSTSEGRAKNRRSEIKIAN